MLKKIEDALNEKSYAASSEVSDIRDDLMQDKEFNELLEELGVSKDVLNDLIIKDREGSYKVDQIIDSIMGNIKSRQIKSRIKNS